MPSSACDWSSDVCSSDRSEEHTSELQSRSDLVCRLLLEKKKKRHAIKMIGVTNTQIIIASLTQNVTLAHRSNESKNDLENAGITTAYRRIKSMWTPGGK